MPHYLHMCLYQLSGVFSRALALCLKKTSFCGVNTKVLSTCNQGVLESTS